MTAYTLLTAYAEFAEKEKGSREHRQIRELARLQTEPGSRKRWPWQRSLRLWPGITIVGGSAN